MMAQYLDIKAAHQDYLLFYRMGDFYELFFEDAAKAASALDIALTKRGKHLGDDIPMCGVPVHAAEAYLEKLIRKGFRVAVCEQMEDPELARKRGAKAPVRREVIPSTSGSASRPEDSMRSRAAAVRHAAAESAGAPATTRRNSPCIASGSAALSARAPSSALARGRS